MGNPGKRRHRRRAQTAVAAICVLLIFGAAAAGYGIWKAQGDEISVSVADREPSADSSDSITYEGRQYAYNDHLSNFLFMGVDTAGETKSTNTHAGQADAIFLVSWDRVLHDMTVIAIPRDTMTEIEVFSTSGQSLGMTEDHINLAYAYGDGRTKSCTLMKEAVSNLFYGLPIQGYCSVDLEGIAAITAAVGGVTVTIPDDSLSDVNDSWVSGAQVTLDETNAEQFVRYRDTGQSQSAMGRLDRQIIYIKAWGEKAGSLSRSDSSAATDIYEKLEAHMITNIGNDQFVKIMENADENSNVDFWTIPGTSTEGELFDEFYADDQALYGKIIETFYKPVE